MSNESLNNVYTGWPKLVNPMLKPFQLQQGKGNGNPTFRLIE